MFLIVFSINNIIYFFSKMSVTSFFYSYDEMWFYIWNKAEKVRIILYDLTSKISKKQQVQNYRFCLIVSLFPLQLWTLNETQNKLFLFLFFLEVQGSHKMTHYFKFNKVRLTWNFKYENYIKLMKNYYIPADLNIIGIKLPWVLCIFEASFNNV